MRISDWSSDVCSSDLARTPHAALRARMRRDLCSLGPAAAAAAAVRRQAEQRDGHAGSGRVTDREHGSRSTGPAVAIVRDLDMPKAAHAALCAGRLEHRLLRRPEAAETFTRLRLADAVGDLAIGEVVDVEGMLPKIVRSEEHTSELQSLMRISYA